MGMAIGDIEPRQELGIFSLQVRNLEGLRWGFHFPILLQDLHRDGAGVSCKTPRVNRAIGANEVSFIVITGRMRATEIKTPQYTGRCGKSDEGGVAAFVNRTVVGPSVMHARPNLVGKFVHEKDRLVGDMNS